MIPALHEDPVLASGPPAERLTQFLVGVSERAWDELVGLWTWFSSPDHAWSELGFEGSAGGSVESQGSQMLASAGPPIVLLAGGLATMALLLTVMLVRRTDPPDMDPGHEAGGSAAATATVAREPEMFRGRSRPLQQSPDRDPVFERGQRAGARLEASSLDDVLSQVQRFGLGEPMITERLANLTVIRMRACGGCLNGNAGPGDPTTLGCGFEAGFLEGALDNLHEGGVIVRESACRDRGDPHCEFEAWH